MVVTRGVGSARSSPFSFTTMPMISGRSVPEREELSSATTSSLSAICFTCLGETKLTASMCLNPASTNSFRYSAFVSVGMKSASPCHASLGHSISFTVSISGLQDSRFEFADFGVECRGFQRLDQCIARVRRIDDGVHPEAGCGVALIGLVLVGGPHGFVQFFFGLFVYLLAFALELLQLDFNQRAGGGIAAHDSVASRRPGKNESRIVSLTAHRVVAGAKTSAANHGDLRHHRIRHGVYHFCAGAPHAAPLRCFAHHAAVHVGQKDKRYAVLVAGQNDARCSFV